MLQHGHPGKMPRTLFLIALVSLIMMLPGAVSGQAGDYDKLDPTLKQLIEAPSLAQTQALRPVTKVMQDETYIDVFIRTTGGQTTFAVPDLQVKSIAGDIVVANLPVDRLLDLTTHAGVRSIQSASVWKTMIDQSVPASNTLQVRKAYNVRGKNVIVGVIDTGIDPGHLDFRSLVDDTRSRILFFWDMSRTDGIPPRGFDSAGGSEIDSTFINAKLRLGDINFNNNDLNGHGTHVAGTAAGNGGGTQFIGTSDQRDGKIIVTSSPHPHILTGTDIQTNVTIVPTVAGDWTVSVRGEKGDGTGVVDMWIVDNLGLGVEFSASDGDQLLLTGQPASTKNAITVGSYVTKTDWVDSRGFFHSRGVVVGTASTFSSPGPSRDGRQKPEISGPGEAIAAPRGEQVDADPDNILTNTRYMILFGTSMATPHVTGAVALALEEARQRGLRIDAIQIRDALQTSAISDADTGPVPNDKWGYGKLDVEALFTELFGGPLTVTLASFTANAEGRRVTLDWEIADASAHAGFQIYRSSTPGTAGRELLTPQLIQGDTHLTFIDIPSEPGTYYYWLADVSSNGHTTFHGPIVVNMPLVPSTFRLAQNAPNPFNPSTLLEYDLPRAAHVTLKIYDALGREVRTLIETHQQAGFYQIPGTGWINAVLRLEAASTSILWPPTNLPKHSK